jgi:hypothetical protein
MDHDSNMSAAINSSATFDLTGNGIAAGYVKHATSNIEPSNIKL